MRDNGVGIARDQMARIFEPFVQADRERDALQGGLGLGLAIVSNLVQRHGGTISVHSEGRGRGAAFTVELPTVTGAEPPREAARQKPSRARANVRVLVVDDNVDIAEMLCEALEDEGFKTSVAHDGQGALVRWRSFLPHAGVLDVGMPGPRRISAGQGATGGARAERDAHRRDRLRPVQRFASRPPTPGSTFTWSSR